MPNYVDNGYVTDRSTDAKVQLWDKDGLKLAGAIPAATATVVGGVKQAAAQADSEATDAAGLVTDFNALLAKLRTAGILDT